MCFNILHTFIVVEEGSSRHLYAVSLKCAGQRSSAVAEWASRLVAVVVSQFDVFVIVAFLTIYHVTTGKSNIIRL